MGAKLDNRMTSFHREVVEEINKSQAYGESGAFSGKHATTAVKAVKAERRKVLKQK